ncbi:MAG TPA: hypothetical protein ENL03_00390, partial [Phycisphaerae bacterium]|nr:hypothetical protein [Phycisphaerae bacterium]
MESRLRTFRSFIQASIVVIAAWSQCAFAGPGGQEPAGFALRVETAAKRAKVYLAAQIDKDGMCRGEYDDDDPKYGGKTALCAYALLSLGPDPQAVALPKATKWLRQAKLTGTYPIALRACVL